MRLMQRIRTRFRVFFIAFALIFVVSVFAGLGLGFSGSIGRRLGTAGSDRSSHRTIVPGENSVASINGMKISYDVFMKQLQVQQYNSRGQAPESNDPWQQFKKWSDLLDEMFTQEMLKQYAKEKNLSVSESDVSAEIQKRVDVMFPQATPTGPSKSLAGELGGRLRRTTEREKNLAQYVESNGTTMSALKTDVRSQLIVQKAYEAIQSEEQGKSDAKAQEKIKKIQAGIKGGEDFGALAKQYSDDTGTRDLGGVMSQFVPRGFFDAAFDKVVFDMKVGTISEPIKVEFGYQIVKLLDKKEAKGPAFEKAKASLTAQIQQEKGKDYKVTEEDLKNKYEQVKVQHITLRTLVDRETAGRIYWMTFAAKKEIFEPMILAWRAANSEPLYFPEVSKTTPQQIAKDSVLSPTADLSKLNDQIREFARVKLMRYQYSYGDPPDDLKPLFADYKLVYGKVQDPQKPPAYPTLVKIYPLAAGLVKQAIKMNDGYAAYDYALASVDDLWVDDLDARKLYPLDVNAARAEIESSLNEAIKLYENDGFYYALAGKNYADWVKPEQAREMLTKAEKFAPGDVDLLRILSGAYRANGDNAKADDFQDQLLQAQQKLWQQQGNYFNFQQ
jgi:parvulin-like peptidyl-prolyl isomerase